MIRPQQRTPALKTLLLGLALLGTSAVNAQPEEYQDVPIEVARWLYPAGTRFLDDLPDDLRGFVPPAGIRILGTIAHHDDQMLLETDVPVGQALEALRRAILQLQDWRELRDFLVPPAVFAGAPPTPVVTQSSVCNDRHGQLRLYARPTGLQVLRSTLPVSGGNPLSCADLEELTRGNLLLEQITPGLTPPQGSRAQLRSLSGRSNSTSQEAELLDVTETLAEVLEDFLGQLAAQGWEAQADWAGELSAGARLQRRVEGRDASLMLGLLQLEDGKINVRVALSLDADAAEPGALGPEIGIRGIPAATSGPVTGTRGVSSTLPEIGIRGVP